MVQRLTASFVLGYHGCDLAVAERLLLGEDFKKSNNQYDWLGPGIYFWEANPKRGLEFARELGKRSSSIEEPAVIGAVVDLGLCLDLTTTSGIRHVKLAHQLLIEMSDAADRPLPKNSPDQLRRDLDCAVLRVLHDMRKNDAEPPLDTVRGVFIEGGQVYEGSGFHEKTHIQICVCNPECIKGVFRVPKHQLS